MKVFKKRQKLLGGAYKNNRQSSMQPFKNYEKIKVSATPSERNNNMNNNTNNNNNNTTNNENNINIITNRYLSVPELYKKFRESGTEIINVKVDDESSPIYMGIGKTPESEQEALSMAIIGSNGNSYEAMKKMAIIANLTAKGISPDEEYEGKFISYKNKTLYDMFGEPIISLKDIKCELPDEATKALLIERYKNEESKISEEFEEEDY